MARFKLQKLEERIAPSKLHCGYEGSGTISKSKSHRDNGWGNGDDDAPGRSEFNNNAENAGGNADNTADSPGNSGNNCNPNR